MCCCGQWGTQLRYMMWKNWILKKRAPFGSLMEVLLPVLLMLVMVGIRGVVDLVDNPAALNLNTQYYQQRPVDINHALSWTTEKTLKPNMNVNDMQGKIGMVPDNAEARNLAQYLFNVTIQSSFYNNSDGSGAYLAPGVTWEDFFMFFPTVKDMDKYTALENYGRHEAWGTPDWRYPLLFAVVLDNWPTLAPGDITTDATWDYTLRFNASLFSNGKVSGPLPLVPSTNLPVVDKISQQSMDDRVRSFQRYAVNGFVAIQNVVDTYIMTRKSGAAFPNDLPPFLTTQLGMFAYAPFITDTFVSIVEGVLGLFFTVFFMFGFSRMVRALVEEKELKIKESMKMMGLPSTVLWLSWILTYLIMFLITAILITIVTSGSVFKHSDKGVVFIFFFFFLLSTLALACLFSTFFDRSKTAATLSSLVFLALFFPYWTINGADTSMGKKQAAALCSPVAFALGAYQLVVFEAAGFGSQRSNLTDEVDNFSLSAALGMLVLDTLLYFVLAFYCDKVVPSRFGTTLKPWFFLLPSYWRNACGCKRAPISADQLQGTPSSVPAGQFEDVAPEVKKSVAISIKNLRKEFDGQTRKIVAVDGTSLDVYENQILSLLGHNGAGKSTTISMLTGLYPPSSGDAYIYGQSISTEMNAVRENIGICPQEDILFPILTVYEHLVLYAALRGKTGKGLEDVIDEMLVEISLREKKNVFSSSLSGGQKRKLCTAMAMIGGAKVIFLDEPTSGMDPYSRRSFWSFLKKRKEGRCIVLTTHMMDEADQLGDRIAIMAGGQVRCCGSSLFLKNLYGVGYTMVNSLVPHPPAGAVHALTGLVTQHIPDVEEPKQFGTEVAYRLPFTANSAFPQLFSALDSDIQEGSRAYGVQNYGVSVTTLEEVFLRVDKEAHDLKPGGKAAKEVRTISVSSKVAGEQKHNGYGAVQVGGVPADDPFTRGFQRPEHLFRTHFRAMITKRFHNFKRDRKAICCQVILPVVIIIIGLLLIESSPVRTDFDRLELAPTQYEKSPMSIYNTDFNLPTTNCTGAQPLTCSGFNEVDCAVDPRCTWTRNYCQIVDACKDPNRSFGSGQLFNVLTVPSAFGATMMPTMTRSAKDVQHWLLSAQGKYPGPDAMVDCSTLPITSDGPQVVKVSACPSDFPQPTPFPAAKADGPMYGAYMTPAPREFSNGGFDQFRRAFGDDKQLPGTIQPVMVLANVSGIHSPPIYVNLLNNAVLRNATSDKRRIRLNSQPFAMTAGEKSRIEVGFSLSSIMILSIGFCFIPASFVMLVIRERETNAKHQQLISGVTPLAYWISSFVWDFSAYVITSLLAMIVIAAYNIEELSGENAGATIFVFIAYGIGVTSFSYAASFLFSTPSGGQNGMIFFNIITGVMLVIVSFVLDRISSTKDINKPLKFLYRLSPNYCFGDALMNMLFRENVILMGAVTPALDLKIAGWDILYLILEGIVFFAIALIIEHLKANPTFMSKFMRRAEVPPDGAVEDQDVAAERQRLLANRPVESQDENWIRCEGLKKTYVAHGQTKAAVKDFWLGIRAGECFGFLGNNGAGKSSTLAMLSGDRVPTDGRAFLQGIDMLSQPQRVRQLIGYCPQQDALFELLTAKEHLELYARIKGVPESDLASFVEKMIDRLSLRPWANEIASSYSGGNKRKLSVGVALIGNPPIVFLDEPSTGMDPASRRSMWDLISTTMAGRSVMLTTHSMEECEALCQRIGVMVSGRLRCLGSSQHLKSRFGQGYQLDATIRIGGALPPGERKTDSSRSEITPAHVRLDEAAHDMARVTRQEQEATTAAVQKFTSFLHMTFPGCAPLEAHENRLKFSLPPMGGLGEIFTKIEAQRDALAIVEYSVSQTTLEQIFLSFAKMQEEESKEVAGLVTK